MFSLLKKGTIFIKHVYKSAALCESFGTLGVPVRKQAFE
jgi:hypothetical protein